MGDLEVRAAEAAHDRMAMDRLLRDYQPFIRKQALRGGAGLDRDDCMSLAMMAFAGAVRQYDAARGAFLPFAELCIRSRLLDERRTLRRGPETLVPLNEEDQLAAPDPWEREIERQALAQEIGELDRALALCGVTFGELPAVCPSQRRARSQCLQMAACIAADESLCGAFLRSGRLPQGELARRFQLSVKTVEKHRKYIAALTVLLTGDYPGIRAFLPKGEELQ